MASRDGGPAFPRKRSIHENPDRNGIIHDPPQDGMSLRDWFAGMAMQGLSSTSDSDGQWTGIESSISKEAYRIADWMLAEREREVSHERS
jgi:hypothetical protein